MEPKFQSSFIPKGPLSTTSVVSPAGRDHKEKSFFTFVATVIFIISVVLAIGMFGYKYYLKYSIDKMGVDLENAQATLEPEVINELTRLDSRINVTKTLISKHRVLSPLFEFLEISTPRTLRFNDFRYEINSQGLYLSMKGEARGYATLALLDDLLSKSPYFKNTTFSNLTLNDKGDVNFAVQLTIDPDLLSYSRTVESNDLKEVAPASEPDSIDSTNSTSTSATSTNSRQASSTKTRK